MVDELSEEMKKVRLLLEKILSVLKLAKMEKVLKTKEEILRNETKRRIYELCDGRHTVTDIVSALGTTQPNVSYHLSTLLESGLVLYEDMGGNRFYFKTLE
jgi:DNA-binding transcriptional ArsR family regulator